MTTMVDLDTGTVIDVVNDRNTARQAKTLFDTYIAWADPPEMTRLLKTIENTKRTDRGYRSRTNYRSRIMLHNATRSAA